MVIDNNDQQQQQNTNNSTDTTNSTVNILRAVHSSQNIINKIFRLSTVTDFIKSAKKEFADAVYAHERATNQLQKFTHKYDPNHIATPKLPSADTHCAAV